MKILEGNRIVLEQKCPEIVERIKAINMDEVGERIGIYYTPNGNMIPQVQCRERWWRLNSRLDPELAAACYAERYSARLYQVYFIFGFSDGRHIRHILNQCDDTNRIVAYIPDVELFGYVCCFFDIADLIADKRVSLYTPEVGENLERILSSTVGYSNVRLLEFCILPDYDVLYTKACESFMDDVIEKVRMEYVQRSTRLAFSRMIPRHMLFHMKNLIYQRNIEQLRRALELYDLEKIPAIVVSAGPSLDKNVKELHKAQGKAFIIVVDAALRTILREGIQPDMVCSIDPESPDSFFENLDLSGVIWSCGRLTRPRVVENYGGTVFYQGEFTPEWNGELSRILGYTFPELLSGGCVTAEAFLIAQYLGFRKLVLVGQDMAFTGGVSHTSGIEGAFGENDAYIESRMRVQVEGVDGSLLETDFQMWYYKQWFEKLIRLNKDTFEVIDATEGGAHIEGTLIQPLGETIERVCLQKIPIYEIEREIEPAFSEEQQEILLGKLKKLKKEAVGLKKYVEEAIAQQERLLKIVQRCGSDKRRIQRDMELMMEQNEKVFERDLLILLKDYAMEEEYKLGDSIYTEENMGVDTLIKQSLALYRGYRKGLDLLEEDIDAYIIKD
ncbi:MAG: motility associated factor glycosyltransferase family protein [Roseburia sp.]